MLQQQVTERVLLLSFDCRNCEESSDECFAKIVAWKLEALGEIFQLLLRADDVVGDSRASSVTLPLCAHWS